jgi:hypothetical protein
MQNSNVVPIRTVPLIAMWAQGLDDAAVYRIKSAARQNIDLLQIGVDQCVHIAIDASEDVAATMIDYAIQLSAQAKDAIKRYGVTAARWDLG